MGDSAMTVVAIFLAAILMFVFPLMTMAAQKDKVATTNIQTVTEEFLNKVRTTGKLTQEDYDNFILTLASTGNTFNVELTRWVSDENPSKKINNASVKIGDNVYYVLYTTQILNSLSTSGSMSLNEGDIVSVKVENTNVTIAEQLRNFFYRVTGNNSIAIEASASGIVTANGN